MSIIVIVLFIAILFIHKGTPIRALGTIDRIGIFTGAIGIILKVLIGLIPSYSMMSTAGPVMLVGLVGTLLCVVAIICFGYDIVVKLFGSLF